MQTLDANDRTPPPPPAASAALRRRRRLAAVAVAAALLAACGGGGDGGDDGVASLGGGDDATTTTAASGAPTGGRADEAAFEDAMLEYAQCMRDEGIDYPDPQFDEGGRGLVVMGGGPGEEPPSEAEMEAMEAADEACHDVLDEAMASLPEPSAAEQEEMQDNALAMSQCMRDHGIEEFPDPQFEQGGGVSIGFGPDSGIDPSSPEFQEAQEACAEEVGGFGRPAGPPEGDE